MCEHCEIAKHDELRSQVVTAFQAYIDALLCGDTQRVALRDKYIELKKEYEAWQPSVTT